MQTSIPFVTTAEDGVHIPNKRHGWQQEYPNIGVRCDLSDLPMKDRELAEAVAEAFAKHGFSLADKIRNL